MAHSQQLADTSTGSTVILIENLANTKNVWKLSQRLFRMFRSVGVIASDIVKIEVDNHQGEALVYLRTQEVEEFVLEVFSDIRNVINYFDIRKLTSNPMGLKVSKGKGNSRKAISAWGELKMASDRASVNEVVEIVSTPTPPETREEAIQPTTVGGHLAVLENTPKEHSSETSFSNATTNPKFELLTEEDEESSSSSSNKRCNVITPNDTATTVVTTTTTATTATTATTSTIIPSSPDRIMEDNKGNSGSSKAIMVDVKTSTPQISPCFCPETIFYHRDQYVGTESRHVEFKRGGIVSDLRLFRNLVGRYLCAFLNTEGGVIYFGVTDDGKAIGISLNQKNEDDIRLMIDNAVSMIRPDVPTTAYSINFARIMDGNGQLEGSLKVLEICVHPRVTPKVLHSFDNNVYVRRDGSLRTLANY